MGKELNYMYQHMYTFEALIDKVLRKLQVSSELMVNILSTTTSWPLYGL